MLSTIRVSRRRLGTLSWPGRIILRSRPVVIRLTALGLGRVGQDRPDRRLAHDEERERNDQRGRTDTKSSRA